MQPESFFYITILSALVALIYFKKFRGTKYVYFLYFIFFTFLIDKINNLNRVYHFIKNGQENNNNPIINFYVVITFFFFFWFYKNIFHEARNKKLMSVFMGLYSIFILVDFFYFKDNFKTNFLLKLAVFGSVLLIITLILISIELLKNHKVINNIERSIVFWITLGCFLFYVGIIPVLIYSKDQIFQGVFKYILVILNLFAHLTFILGFMLSKREYNY